MWWMWIVGALAAPVHANTAEQARQIVDAEQAVPRSTVVLVAEDPRWAKVTVFVDDAEVETTAIVQAPGVIWWRAESRKRGEVRVQIDRCSESLCVPGETHVLPFRRAGHVHRFEHGQRKP